MKTLVPPRRKGFFAEVLVVASLLVACVSYANAEEAEGSKLERTRALVNEVQAPAAKPDTDLSTTAWKMAKGLAITLGVLCVGLGVAKKFGVTPNATGKKRIKLLDRISVSRKSSLILAEVDGRQILLAVGGDPVCFHGDFTSESMFGASLQSTTKDVA